MKTLPFLGMLGVAYGLASPITAQTDEAFFLLTQQTAKCIESSRAELAGQEGAVIFIKPHDCVRDVDGNASTCAPADAPDTTTLQTQNDTDEDALLFLSRTHLACFADISMLDDAVNAADTLWRFYHDTCQFAPDV